MFAELPTIRLTTNKVPCLGVSLNSNNILWLTQISKLLPSLRCCCSNIHIYKVFLSEDILNTDDVWSQYWEPIKSSLTYVKTTGRSWFLFKSTSNKRTVVPRIQLLHILPLRLAYAVAALLRWTLFTSKKILSVSRLDAVITSLSSLCDRIQKTGNLATTRGWHIKARTKLGSRRHHVWLSSFHTFWTDPVTTNTTLCLMKTQKQRISDQMPGTESGSGEWFIHIKNIIPKPLLIFFLYNFLLDIACDQRISQHLRYDTKEICDWGSLVRLGMTLLFKLSELMMFNKKQPTNVAN